MFRGGENAQPRESFKLGRDGAGRVRVAIKEKGNGFGAQQLNQAAEQIALIVAGSDPSMLRRTEDAGVLPPQGLGAPPVSKWKSVAGEDLIYQLGFMSALLRLGDDMDGGELDKSIPLLFRGIVQTRLEAEYKEGVLEIEERRFGGHSNMSIPRPAPAGLGDLIAQLEQEFVDLLQNVKLGLQKDQIAFLGLDMVFPLGCAVTAPVSWVHHDENPVGFTVVGKRFRRDRITRVRSFTLDLAYLSPVLGREGGPPIEWRLDIKRLTIPHFSGVVSMDDLSVRPLHPQEHEMLSRRGQEIGDLLLKDPMEMLAPSGAMRLPVRNPAGNIPPFRPEEEAWKSLQGTALCGRVMVDTRFFLSSSLALSPPAQPLQLDSSSVYYPSYRRNHKGDRGNAVEMDETFSCGQIGLSGPPPEDAAHAVWPWVSFFFTDETDKGQQVGVCHLESGTLCLCKADVLEPLPVPHAGKILPELEEFVGKRHAQLGVEAAKMKAEDQPIRWIVCGESEVALDRVCTLISNALECAKVTMRLPSEPSFGVIQPSVLKRVPSEWRALLCVKNGECVAYPVNTRCDGNAEEFEKQPMHGVYSSEMHGGVEMRGRYTDAFWVDVDRYPGPLLICVLESKEMKFLPLVWKHISFVLRIKEDQYQLWKTHLHEAGVVVDKKMLEIGKNVKEERIPSIIRFAKRLACSRRRDGKIESVDVEDAYEMMGHDP